MYICVCARVSDREIQNQVDQGKTSLKSVMKTTNLGMQCGKCCKAANEVIRAHQANNRCCGPGE